MTQQQQEQEDELFSHLTAGENEEEPAEQNLTVDRTEEEPVSNHCVSDTFTAPEERPLRPLPSANWTCCRGLLLLM